MPIRMVEDEPGGNSSSNSGGSSNGRKSFAGGGGVGGGLGNILGAVLPMLFKRPKLLIVLVGVGVLLYFFMGRGCSSPISDGC